LPHRRKKKEAINKIVIPTKYRKGSANDGSKSLYFTSISTYSYGELALHNRNPRKYPNTIDI